MSTRPTASVQCPQCEQVIDIPIEVIITDPDDDQQFIRCDPDLTDVWAHAWTHEDPVLEAAQAFRAATAERMRMGVPVTEVPPRPVPPDPGWELEFAKTPWWFWPLIALIVIVFVGGPALAVVLS